MNIGDIISATDAALWYTTDDGLRPGVNAPVELRTAIGEVVVDSRQARPGSLFTALPGSSTDGHMFVRDAFRRGALGAVVTTLPSVEGLSGHYLFVVRDSLQALHAMARYWRRRLPVTVVAVTGSIGKTSVKEAAAAVLEGSGQHRVLKSRANYNTEVGLPLELLRLDAGHGTAVLEMGMYARGDIAVLCDIARPQIGIVTNIEPVHLERLGHIDRIAQTKAELVHALPHDGLAILNGDDRRVRAMSDSALPPVALFGHRAAARSGDFWADEITGHGLKGFKAVYHHGPRSLHVDSPTPGTHNVMTLLPAIVVAHRLGVQWSDILDRLRAFRLPDRLTIVPGPNGATLIDDRYNAAAASVIAALGILREEQGRKLALLGEMYELGAEEEVQHRRVGAAASGLDALILLGERTRWIAEEAQTHGLSRARITRVANNEQAIEAARRLLQPGDVLLIKGSRGLRMESIVNALRADPGHGDQSEEPTVEMHA